MEQGVPESHGRHHAERKESINPAPALMVNAPVVAAGTVGIPPRPTTPATPVPARAPADPGGAVAPALIPAGLIPNARHPEPAIPPDV